MSSEYIIELQEGLRATLPFDDKRDFEEAKKGFIAAPPYKQIMAEPRYGGLRRASTQHQSSASWRACLTRPTHLMHRAATIGVGRVSDA